MSFVSRFILPALKKHLVEALPEISIFILKELHDMGQKLVEYVEKKIEKPKIDSSRDGK